MKKKGLVLAALFGMSLLYFAGCQKADNDQTGRIIVKITDAPFPIGWIDDASVTITKVEIRDREKTNEKPFITVFEGSREFKLLDLRNGVTADLLDVEIPAGNYNLIRVYVENASLSIKDYDTYSVKVPSGSQTGIKIFIEPSLKVASELTAEVLLDFNVDRSFVLNGNMTTPAGIKGFKFKPVIRAVNNTTAGVVEGVVMDTESVLLTDVSVWIEQEDIVTTAFTNDEGYYAMPGIPAGLYSLSAVKEGFNTLTYNDVEVIEGNLTVQDFMLVAIEE